MNNIIMRKIGVSESYTPLAAEKTVVTVTISAVPTNVGNVFFKGDDGSDVPWSPGEWHTLKSVNLADIQIKGTVGDIVTIVGGTW